LFVYGPTNQHNDLVNAYDATYGYNDLFDLQFAQQDYDRLKNTSLDKLGMTQAEKDMYLNQLRKDVLAQDKIARNKKYGGKMPKEVLRARAESHMSKEAADAYVNNYGYGSNMYGKGSNMIKRADGSYSSWGLWDSIRAKAKKNKDAGKKGKEPTEEMLEQEKKIKGNSKMYGSKMYENGGGEDGKAGKAGKSNSNPKYRGPIIEDTSEVDGYSASLWNLVPTTGYKYWSDYAQVYNNAATVYGKNEGNSEENKKAFETLYQDYKNARPPLHELTDMFYPGSYANAQALGYLLPKARKTFNSVFNTNYKMGGNMYKYGSTMGNMYYPGGGMDLANPYAINTPLSTANLLAQARAQYDEVKFDYEPNPLNTAVQYLPAIANLGMGLLAPSEDYTGDLGRMQPVDMPEIVPGQELVNINQGFASAQDALGAVTGTSGLQSLQDSRNETTAKLFTQLRNENAQFAALEEKLNLEVQKGNMTAQQMELQLTEAAEAAKSGMLGKGLEQIADIGQARETDRMTAEYLKLLAPQYT
jgi:hypothetical protein